MDQAEIVAFLERPEAHDGRGPVERIDTHISHVFLAGDRVLKLKRAVKLPYVDFSTVEKRREACEAEIAVNRRLRQWLDGKGLKHAAVETPGAHTWMVWRRNLATLAPMLFR